MGSGTILALPFKMGDTGSRAMKKIFYTFFIIFTLLTLPGQPLWAGVVEGPLFVALREDRLTVRAIDVPLKQIVQEITRQMDTIIPPFPSYTPSPPPVLPPQGEEEKGDGAIKGGGEKGGGRVMDIRVYGEPQVATEKVTVEFHDLPIHEGFAKILAGYNAVYVYSSGGGEEDTLPYQLAEVWIFFQGKGSGPSGQIGSERGASPMYLSSTEMGGTDPPISRGGSKGTTTSVRSAGKEVLSGLDSGGHGESSGRSMDQRDLAVLMGLLQDPDPTVRLAAVETLSGLGSQVTPEELKDLADAALNSEDPKTRIAILKSTLDLPPEMVIYHALYDPVPQVRVAALWALRWGNDTKNKVMDVVQQAVADTDVVVQARAEEIMKFLLGRDAGS